MIMNTEHESNQHFSVYTKIALRSSNMSLIMTADLNVVIGWLKTSGEHKIILVVLFCILDQCFFLNIWLAYKTLCIVCVL